MAKARDKVMSVADWSAWLKAMGMSGRQASEALGVSTNMPVNARKVKEDDPGGVGLTIALACSALAAGLGPWSPANAREAELARDIMALIRGERLTNDTGAAARKRKP